LTVVDCKLIQYNYKMIVYQLVYYLYIEEIEHLKVFYPCNCCKIDVLKYIKYKYKINV